MHGGIRLNFVKLELVSLVFYFSKFLPFFYFLISNLKIGSYILLTVENWAYLVFMLLNLMFNLGSVH